MRVKDIPGYEGHYIVADIGLVIATYRQFTDCRGYLTSRPSVALGAMKDRNGYRQIALCKPGQPTKQVSVHRLVAQAFVPPYDGDVVNHIDGDRKNNRYKNLEWCTHQANTLHYHMRMRRIDLTAREIDEIIALEHELPPSSIARRYNVHVTVVYHLLSSRRRNQKRQLIDHQLPLP